MAKIIELETDRLYLRQWKESDLEPFARMNSDPKVMKFFPSLLSTEESDQRAKICRSLIKERGWGFWALEEKASQEFIGFTGLHAPSNDLLFSPCIEIGWRLSQDFWGMGLVTEAANAVLSVGFRQLNLKEIVSFTAKNNFRSSAVMERLHMVKDPQNFEHPALPPGHELREHCLYRLSKSQWCKNAV